MEMIWNDAQDGNVYEYVKSVGYPLLICDFIAMVVRWPISFNGMMIYPLGGIHRLPQLPQSYHADGDDFSTHQHGDALGMVYATEETTLDDDLRSFYYWICPNRSVKWPGSILLAVLTSIDRGFPSGPPNHTMIFHDISIYFPYSQSQ